MTENTNEERESTQTNSGMTVGILRQILNSENMPADDTEVKIVLTSPFAFMFGHIPVETGARQIIDVGTATHSEDGRDVFYISGFEDVEHENLVERDEGTLTL